MSDSAAAVTVDLNADLGEEITDDAGLMQVVTSANVACGYHAGSAAVMRTVCELAAERGVVLGAQVSYADRANFGRVELEVSPRVLSEQVADQVGALRDAATAAGLELAYLKPHGALYHRAGRDEVQAAAVLAGSGALPVLGMAGSVLLELAAADGRQVRLEGFPDRAYTAQGGLVPRGEPGAVIEEADLVCASALALGGRVDSLCLHGDTPGAVDLAHRVRAAIEASGGAVAPCW